MIKCDENCVPCCDYCIYCEHEEIVDQDEENEWISIGASIGCKLHEDEEHQDLAIFCSYCDDFHCIRA